MNTETIKYTLGVVAVTLLDAGSTYLRTPDLQREVNPLIRAMGGGWTALWLVNFVVVAICVVAFSYGASKRDYNAFPRGLGLKEFLEYDLFFGKQPWWKCLLKTPTRRESWSITVAFTFAFGLPVFRLIVSASNLLLVASTAYSVFLNKAPLVLFAAYAALAIIASLWLQAGFRHRKYAGDDPLRGD